ncbi:hypothetical protein [Beijerinckia mobilis]|uniref:hyaluronate lyase N-terminal domain-containing protein n=1 Tax=Beijerinckia mobilis TaxID=231434 RepID=UPI00068C5881|nr:hypothetical protein [Beijerinckia mobilis]
MAVQVQLRRGAATDIASFRGAPGEIVVDTTNNRLVLCDGVTDGGVPLAKLSEVGQVPVTASAIVAQSQHGATTRFDVAEELVTLSGATSQSTIVIPERAIVFAVSVLVVSAITGVTGFNVDAVIAPGGSTDTPSGRFGVGIGIAAGSSNSGVIGPTAWYQASAIQLTAQGGTFAGGTVRVAIHSLTCGVPQS